NGVNRLPGDDHRHYGRLPSAGCQFQGDTREAGIGVVIGIRWMFKESRAAFAEIRSDFGQPDQGFSSFYLTEKGPDGTERIVPPVVKKSRGFRGDQPLFGVFELAP